MTEKKIDKPIIVALDFADEHSTLKMLEAIDPLLCRVKVGKELFTHCGPELVKRIISDGYEVFLDLKFHDIPNTVAGAVAAAADLGVWMVNVHASGGRNMMEAASKRLESVDAPLLIAVTVLTSMGEQDLKEVGINNSPESQVVSLARLTADCGLAGVVCSAKETQLLRMAVPKDFCLVTPGIRPVGDAAGDQKRVVTPRSAIESGSNYLVIGRPITQAADPDQKIKEILQEINSNI